MGKSSIKKKGYNQELVSLLRDFFHEVPDITEKKMFGGIAFIFQGNMCCGVSGDNLMIRVKKEDYDRFLDEPNIHPMDFTGKPMRGFLYVNQEGWKNPKTRLLWLERTWQHCLSLPTK